MACKAKPRQQVYTAHRAALLPLAPPRGSDGVPTDTAIHQANRLPTHTPLALHTHTTVSHPILPRAPGLRQTANRMSAYMIMSNVWPNPTRHERKLGRSLPFSPSTETSSPAIMIHHCRLQRLPRPSCLASDSIMGYAASPVRAGERGGALKGVASPARPGDPCAGVDGNSLR